MRHVLDEIVSVLNVLPVGERKSAEAAETFVGRNLETEHVSGGQVLGQAIAAGGRTVTPERQLHSLHAYFLEEADWLQDIRFEVQHLRDGVSFSSRRITALQARGPILQMTASWHIDELGFSHQRTMPSVPGPEGLRTDPEHFEAFDWRQVEGALLTHVAARAALTHTWIRAAYALPKDHRLHESLFGYLSSLDFTSTSMLPHMTSALDHSLWLHKPVRVDEWLLVCKESPRAHGACGFVRGDFFTLAGELVASAAQESVLRPRNQPMPAAASSTRS